MEADVLLSPLIRRCASEVDQVVVREAKELSSEAARTHPFK
ncbi:hypothetical protein [Ancylobacter sp.]